MTMQQLLTEWLEISKKEEVKARTYQRYNEMIVSHLLPAFGDKEIETITRREIQDFLNQEKKNGNQKNGKNLSASSINMMLTILNLAFTYAGDRGYLFENPCVRIHRIKTESKKVDAFTIEEQRALETAIMQSNDRCLHGILICLYTGLRIGELLALTWDDVDLTSGIMRIEKTVYRIKDENGWHLHTDFPKTKASDRIIPLPDYIKKMLLKDKENAKTKYIVENKKGEQMKIRSYQYMFEKLTERANVRKLNFHALRHTFATRAIECGMDIRTVADLMGHQNVSVTLNRYAHCMLAHKIEMMKKLPQIF